MEACLFCKSPIKRGQRFCPTCGRGILQASSVNSANADDHTVEPEPTIPSPTEDKTAVCPVCKVAFQPPAGYCERDGTVLEKVETYILPHFGHEEIKGPAEQLAGEATPSEATVEEVVTDGKVGRDQGIKKNGFRLGKRILASAFLIAGVSAIYLYMVGLPGSAAGVEEYLNKVLKTRGFDVTARMEGGGRVVVTGKVQSESNRNAALAIIGSDSKVKGITDNIKVVLSSVDLEQTLNKALDSAGLGEVRARVGRDFVVILSGTAQGEQDKAAALAIARDQQGVKGLNESIQIKRSSVQGKAGETAADFTQNARFKVFGLSPSTWASKKFSTSVTFRVPGPGRIFMEAEWQQQGALALILDNAESHDIYTQKDGASPLKLVYRVTQQDLMKNHLWEATVANFTSNGPMEGSLKITFLSGDANRPFASLQEPAFDANRLEGEINRVLRARGIKGVTAEVGTDWCAILKGSVRSIGEKQKAIETAKQFKAIKEVKDIIFVVGS